MSSTRLPGKVLMKIGKKTVLERVVNRVKAVNLLFGREMISKIVVVTSTNPADNHIERFCKNKRIECFRGSEEDVLERYYKAGIEYNSSHILRICGDCPLLDPVMIYHLLRRYDDSGKNIYMSLNFAQRKVPGGWDAEVFPMIELINAFNFAPKEEREHVTSFIRRTSMIEETGVEKGDFGKIKLDLDTEEDLKFLKEYYEYL